MSLRTRAVAAAVLAAGVAGCRSAAPPVVAPPVVAPPAPVATPAPAPVATPPPAPAPPPRAPEIPNRADMTAPLIRILLSEGPQVRLDDPGRRYACIVDGRPAEIRGPVTATARGGINGLQVGAFAQPGNAKALTVRLQAAGFDARTSTSGGLTRVVAVGSAEEAPASLAGRLAAAGFAASGAAVVVSGGEVEATGEDGATLSGASIRLVPLDPLPCRSGRSAYRGAFDLRATQSGVGLINVLSLESYLRGVVPAEMGPSRFPALEALKAQAVAARTYAAAHVGDHEDEGYDLCATPACQVYGGVDAERPLTNRAVAQTVGVILTWQGAPIDAMYQSTCGGHTEDAAAILPDRAAPYLVGVPCRTESTVRVTGTGRATGWMGPVERLAAVAGRVAATEGVAAEPRALASALGGHRAGAGIPGLLHAFGLDDALILLHGTAGTGVRREVLALLDTFRLPLDAPDGAMNPSAWNLALVLRLAQMAGVVRTVDGRVLPDPAGVRVVADKDGSVTVLTGREMVLERRGGTFRRGDVTVRAGAPATLWCVADRCPAVEVERWEEADAGSAWSWWLRDVPLAQISRALGLSGVTGVEVVRRGESGRALSVVVTAAAGRREVDGFAFRRALELPDTLFVVTLRRTPDGTAAHFVGRGWGHGIGLCQNGAFGLAQAGETFGEILATYYTGATLSSWTGRGKGSP